MQMKEYKYILLDLDGTITDPMIGITRCVEYALNHFGICLLYTSDAADD